MRVLTKEGIMLNDVDTIEQFKVITYLKKYPFTNSSRLFLYDRYTIKVIDSNNDVGYFKYEKDGQIRLLEEENKEMDSFSL